VGGLTGSLVGLGLGFELGTGLLLIWSAFFVVHRPSASFAKVQIQDARATRELSLGA
jgi:hypothetical protein